VVALEAGIVMVLKVECAAGGVLVVGAGALAVGAGALAVGAGALIVGTGAETAAEDEDEGAAGAAGCE
jgi:hypothetical protein